MIPSSSLALYSRTAHAAASQVLAAYSTSFSLATRLLPPKMRGMVEDIYALVRVADEIVDGPAHEAGLTLNECRIVLDELKNETLHALHTGFSANLIVHAFASTGRALGFDELLVRPFFASMRRDLDPIDALTAAEYATYVHGSAEVVGLMRLRAFLDGHDTSPAERARLGEGARRLGAVFQKINFMRDLGDDQERLGRTYFPGLEQSGFDDEARAKIVADIDADLAAARAVIPLLPPGPRRATAVATGLFADLNERLHRIPATALRELRVSVPTSVKLRIAATAVVGVGQDTRQTM